LFFVGFACSALFFCWICVFRVVFLLDLHVPRFFWLLDLRVPCFVLFPASAEGINKPPGDWTPLRARALFVKHHSWERGCRNSCLFVGSASSYRGSLNKTTVCIKVGGRSCS
jgi:hypothetical protein